MNTWDLNLALRSWEQGKAIPATACQLNAIQSQALVFCPLAMAGEDPSLHAVMLGEIGGGSQLLVAADPRAPRARMELFSRLSKIMSSHFQNSLKQDGCLPQLVVPSASAAEVIVALADWLPYLQDPKDGGKQMKQWVQDARLLGGLLQFYSQRAPLTGQQSLLIASEMLSAHFAFGQELRGHLGAQMIWVSPPANIDVALAAAKADQQPMGARTESLFDVKTLGPALEDWAKVERGGSRSLTSFRRQEIEDMLREVLEPIFEATSQAVLAVQDMKLPLLEGLSQVCQRDREAFEYHLSHIAADGKFARRDNASRAAYGLAEREDALQQWEASLLWGDPVRRARAEVDGEILSGLSTSLPSEEGDFMVVTSSQRGLRIRRGDELTWMENGSSVAVISEISQQGSETRVLLSVRPAQDQLPSDGEISQWAGSPPDWFRLSSERGNIARSLKSLPETHQVEPDDSVSPSAPLWDDSQVDPLAALEGLR